MTPYRLVLRAPERFDAAAGYWDGAPDLATLARAVAAHPAPAEVGREVAGAEVRLQGPREAVEAHAARLREAGLV